LRIFRLCARRETGGAGVAFPKEQPLQWILRHQDLSLFGDHTDGGSEIQFGMNFAGKLMNRCSGERLGGSSG
jgi:hypothetical protein